MEHQLKSHPSPPFHSSFTGSHPSAWPFTWEHVGAGKQNLGSHTCTAGTVPTDRLTHLPSPGPHILCQDSFSCYLSLIYIIFKCVYVCLSVCGGVHLSADGHREQR